MIQVNSKKRFEQIFREKKGVAGLEILKALMVGILVVVFVAFLIIVLSDKMMQTEGSTRTGTITILGEFLGRVNSTRTSNFSISQYPGVACSILGAKNIVISTTTEFNQIANFSVLSSGNPFISSNPKVSGGIVYTGVEDGMFYALNKTNLTQIANFSTGAGIYSSPAIANSKVFIPSSVGLLFSLNASNLYQFGNFSISTDTLTPTISNGVIYIGSQTGDVYAINASNLVELASYSALGTVDKSSVLILNNLIYFETDASKIYALNKSNLVHIANFTLDSAGESSPATANGIIYAVSEGNGGDPSLGRVYALNASNLYQFANYTIGDLTTIASPIVVNNQVYIGSSDGKLRSLNASNLVLLNEFTITTMAADPTFYTTPLISNGIVFIGSASGGGGGTNYFYALNASDLIQITNFTVGNEIYSSATIDNGIVYFGSYDGHLYALELETSADTLHITIPASNYTSPSQCTIKSIGGSSFNNLNWTINFTYAYDKQNKVGELFNETIVQVSDNTTSNLGLWLFLAAMIVVVILVSISLIYLNRIGGGGQGGSQIFGTSEGA